MGQTKPADRVVIGNAKDFLIPSSERDRHLMADSWSNGSSPGFSDKQGWSSHDGKFPLRRVCVMNEAETSRSSASHELWEAVLRFPNAPVYATHVARPPFYRIEDKWANLHTMRVLGTGDGPKERIRRIYLLHNGLNETRDLLFHYRLAAWILDGREDAVCIIRPLPSHLTRYPFDGIFNETPLDWYLRSPMDLFRQFLRYTIETRWLLSAVAPRCHYALVGGGRLMSGALNEGETALPDIALGEAIHKEWTLAMERSEDEATETDAQFSSMRLTLDDITGTVTTLRQLLKWQPAEGAPVSVADTDAEPTRAEYPYVHVAGYSMGGFMAQACFFGWPQIICSCTNLFAGGALRDLAPTAFSHPEEWQTVLHALRHEFDAALTGPLASGAGKEHHTDVAGIKKSDFEYMKRIFYEVYLQYSRGDYSSRLAEFSRRLLFVVGGNDPIVRTKSVLDAGPPEGMMLLNLANVSHFPGGAANQEPELQQIEKEQRTYWLPEVGRMIARFSRRTETALHNQRAHYWDGTTRPRGSGSNGRQAKRAKPSADADGLDYRAFERELDALLDVVDARRLGWLLVSRNEIPPVFLGEDGFRAHARALHHDEELIARYVHDLRDREARLRRLKTRMTVLIPKQSLEWLSNAQFREKLLARSETPGAATAAGLEEIDRMREHFVAQWAQTRAFRLVNGSERPKRELTSLGKAEATRQQVNNLALTMLPDVWIGLGADVCKHLRRERNGRAAHESGIIEFATHLAEGKRATEQQMEQWLDEGRIFVINVSVAEFNTRYRGPRLMDVAKASRAFRHWASAYCGS
jgi:hypothetical protein